MDHHEKPGTRITVERTSVTTIRTRHRSHRVYCDICRKEIESAGTALPLKIEAERAGPLQLMPATVSGSETK